MISVFGLAPAAIAIVSALTSPSCVDPPTETVPVLFLVLVPFPVFDAALLAEFVPLADPPAPLCDPVPLLLFVLLAALLAEFVPLADPLAALCEPVPLVLLVLLAALLAEFVPLADPLAALFEPVPLLLFVLLAALLAEFVPLAEPLPLLFEPVPDFEPPFFVFEAVLVFMS